MNWAEQHIQKIETPKTKTKEYIEWGLKLLFTATGITVAFFALMFLGFESVETKEQQEIQMWCDEYMPELSIRACMDQLDADTPAKVTPSVIASTYQVPTGHQQSSKSQAVAEFQGQTMNSERARATIPHPTFLF